jgi:hypothetical protein
MDEFEIKQKLDQLADFEAHKTLIEMDKKALLDDVKVPDEVQRLVSDSFVKMNAVEASFADAKTALREEIDERLAMVFIPEEVKVLLAEIDAKRSEINKDAAERSAEIVAEIHKEQFKIQAETEKATADIYKAIAQRKAEIEAEFSGKSEVVDENIKKLTDEIKAAVKEIGFTVKSVHYMAVYGKGKKSWISDRLERYTEDHPDIQGCYTVGEPNVTLRKV